MNTTPKKTKAVNCQGRKFLLTLNNYSSKGYTGERILKELDSLKGRIYACVSEEVGEQGTPHIHAFVVYENPKALSTMKKLINEAHWDICRGSCADNRDYVFKHGKWASTEKATTSIPGTQREMGTLPEERSCSKPELQILYELINEGMSNYDIISQFPEYMFDITHIDRCRLVLKQEEYRNSWRSLDTTYIYGKTGSGKSRYVMETYGYENVFRITDYLHPFDTYNGEEVIAFEEFNSSIRIQDMLNYLDGYPLKLPARYSDKQACFTKVFILTNLALEKQYPNVQEESKEVWNAFLRRINKVLVYGEDGFQTYNSVEEYMNRSEFVSLSDDDAADLPFS